ncbi:MAG: hypothetical protein U0270_00100 [Labilithrix sp.]
MSRILRRLVRLVGGLALAGAAVGLSACGPDYDHTSITIVSSTYPSNYDFSLSHITLTEGSALTVHLIVYNDDDEKMPVRFVLTDNKKVQFVAQVDPDNYSMLAYEQGKSQLQIFADDEKILSINIDVVAQPAPP